MTGSNRFKETAHNIFAKIKDGLAVFLYACGRFCYRLVLKIRKESGINSDSVKKSARELVRKILLGISVIALVFSAGYLIKAYVIEPYRNSQYEDPQLDTDNEDLTVVPEHSDPVLKKYADFLKLNREFVGLLKMDAISDSNINVVQGDDNYKYLTLGFKGETTRYGTLFVDYRNNLKKLDTNTVIYGHNMRDGSQLGDLDRYSDIDVYREHPTFQFNTIFGDSTWKVFAAFLINSRPESDNGYVFPYRTLNFPSEEKFNEFIKEIKARSYFNNDSVDIKPGDKLITLSTCDSAFDDARFVVMARLVRKGESPSVDTAAAAENNNQRFPQAWYDFKGEENPFADARNYTLD